MIVKENIKELEIRCPQEGDTQSQADEDTNMIVKAKGK